MRKCLNERIKNILNAFLLNEQTDQKTESTALKKERQSDTGYDVAEPWWC